MLKKAKWSSSAVPRARASPRSPSCWSAFGKRIADASCSAGWMSASSRCLRSCSPSPMSRRTISCSTSACGRISASYHVKDWHFVPSNRSDSNTGHPGANQNSQPNGGAATPGAAGNGSYPMQGNPNGSYQNQAMPGGYPQQGMAPANGAYTPPANGGQYQAPPNGTGQPQSSYPPQGSYTGMPNYGGMPGSQPTDGFQNVPEQMASQLPY